MSIPRTPENTFERPEELRSAPMPPRTLRRAREVARPEVAGRAQGAPGQFGGDYEELDLDRPRSPRSSHRVHRSPSHKNRAVAAYTIAAFALLGLGDLATRVIQSSNRPANIAGELEQNPQAVAHDLRLNGSDGVVTVELRNGANVQDEADRIATSAAAGEVDAILGAQQQGDTVGVPASAVLPADDLKAAQLHRAQSVTPQTLIEFQQTRTIGQ